MHSKREYRVGSKREREIDCNYLRFLFSLYACVATDELQYFVFDYLNQWRNIDVVNDENLPEQIRDFMERNFFSTGNLLLPERRILGPIKYNRAELVSVAFSSPNATSNDTLQTFCFNQSSIGKLSYIWILELIEDF